MRPAMAILAAALSVAFPAAALEQRPLSTADLLSMEAVGRTRISPDGQWVVIERQGRWDSAATYRYGALTSHLLTRLEIRRRSEASPALVLHDPGAAAGYLSGPFSPDGRHMVVYRLTEGAWRLGILSLDDLQVRWRDLTPEYPRLGQTVAWRSDRELVLIAREADDLPLFLRLPHGAQDQVSALWRAAASGHTTSTVYVPSGSGRDQREQARPSRLIRLDVATGEEQVLARGEFFDLEISPDGRMVAALKSAEDYQIDVSTPASTGEWLRRRRLVLADLDAGRAIEPLPGQDFITHLLTWSPDGRRLIAYARSDERRFSEGRFWIIGADGEPEALDLAGHTPWMETTWDGIPLVHAGWNGAAPVVQVRAADGARVWLERSETGLQPPVAVGEPGEKLVWARDRLMVLNRNGLKPFGADVPLVRGRFTLTEGAFDGGDRRNHNPDPAWLGRQPLANSSGCLTTAESLRVTCLSGWEDGDAVLSASARDPALLGRRRSAHGSTALTLHQAHASRPLLTVNPALEAIEWGDIVAIEHSGPDGVRLTSWLLRPPRPDGPNPPPVVILAYPGDIHAAPPALLQPGYAQRHLNPHVLAAAGYAVIVPSLPYDRSRGDLGDIGARLEAVLDAAAARGLVDPQRAALIGHSFGGHGVLLAAAQTDRFRAVIASHGYGDLAGIADQRLYWRSTTRDGVPITSVAGWAETGQGGIGRPLALAPKAYINRSPLYAAARIRTPTLLIESDLDGARLGSLFGALYRLNREAALLTGFGEGHTFTSPGNIRELYQRVIAWLDRYLTPTPLQPGQPGAGPGFQRGGDQATIAGGMPDQGVLIETTRHLDRVDQATAGEFAFEQEGS